MMAAPKLIEEGSMDVHINFEEYEDRLQAKTTQPSPFTAYPPFVLGVGNVPRALRTVKSSVPVCIHS